MFIVAKLLNYNGNLQLYKLIICQIKTKGKNYQSSNQNNLIEKHEH